MNNHSEKIYSFKQLSGVVPNYSLYAGKLRLKGLLSFVKERFVWIRKHVRQKVYSVMFFFYFRNVCLNLSKYCRDYFTQQYVINFSVVG